MFRSRKERHADKHLRDQLRSAKRLQVVGTTENTARGTVKAHISAGGLAASSANTTPDEPKDASTGVYRGLTPQQLHNQTTLEELAKLHTATERGVTRLQRIRRRLHELELWRKSIVVLWQKQAEFSQLVLDQLAEHEQKLELLKGWHTQLAEAVCPCPAHVDMRGKAAEAELAKRESADQGDADGDPNSLLAKYERGDAELISIDANGAPVFAVAPDVEVDAGIPVKSAMTGETVRHLPKRRELVFGVDLAGGPGEDPTVVAAEKQDDDRVRVIHISNPTPLPSSFHDLVLRAFGVPGPAVEPLPEPPTYAATLCECGAGATWWYSPSTKQGIDPAIVARGELLDDAVPYCAEHGPNTPPPAAVDRALEGIVDRMRTKDDALRATAKTADPNLTVDSIINLPPTQRFQWGYSIDDLPGHGDVLGYRLVEQPTQGWLIAQERWDENTPDGQGSWVIRSLDVDGGYRGGFWLENGRIPGSSWFRADNYRPRTEEEMVDLIRSWGHPAPTWPRHATVLEQLINDDGPVQEEINAVLRAGVSDSIDLLGAPVLFETDRRGGKEYALPARVTVVRRSHPDYPLLAAYEAGEAEEGSRVPVTRPGNGTYMDATNPVPIPLEGTVHLTVFTPGADLPYREFSVPYDPAGGPRTWRHLPQSFPF